jgi:hypothetical protein
MVVQTCALRCNACAPSPQLHSIRRIRWDVCGVCVAAICDNESALSCAAHQAIRRNEILTRLKEPLRDLSISRTTFKW